MAYVPEYDAPFNRGVERGKELSRASIRERDARITRLEADKALLVSALSNTTSALCSVRKNYEEDLPLWADVSRFIGEGNEALTRIQGDDASNGLGGDHTRCQCGKPATTKYDGDEMCEPCARYCARRDFEEGDMPGGFGE